MSTRTLAYIGTLNRSAPYVATWNGPGLAVAEFNETTGALTLLSETGGIDNPSYVAVDDAGRTVYATSEVFGWDEGTVSAYRTDPGTGALTYINKQATRGSITAQASIDRTGRWLLVANYRIGADGARPPQAVVVYPIEADGGLGAPVCSFGHSGSGPNAVRQEGPHPHCAIPSPDNRFVLVADLGLDRIVVYTFDAATGLLSPAPVPHVQLAPGTGPRHLVFDPSGRFAFVTNEMASSVTALAWNAAAGTLAPLQTIATIPADFHEENSCSDIGISADGRFLYAANRGHDSIAAFAVDTATGHLTALGQITGTGRTPRQFTIDLTGRFLLVAFQNSDAVAVLARDPATGLLSDTGQRGAIGTPMCIKLVRVPK